LSCSLAVGVVHRLVPQLVLPPAPSPLIRMLGGSPMPVQSAAGLAIAVDCVHAAVMGARFGGNAGTAEQMATARFRARCIACKRTRDIVLS
jgi:hypothetical protein